MNEHTAYLNIVDDWVLDKAVHQIEWSELLNTLPSVYPAIVMDSAIRLGKWNNVQHSDMRGGARSLHSNAVDFWRRRKLTTPHPLDGCWWFADETLKMLSDWVSRFCCFGDLIALYGTPTLFHYMQRETTARELILIDRIIKAGDHSPQQLKADLLKWGPNLQRRASVAVVDPPWYELETRAFLSAAQGNVLPGGKILLSLPPVGTRPGILRERAELLAWCKFRGMRLIEHLPLALRYLSPPFEVNALRAANVPLCPSDWRRGDLAVLECLESARSSETPAQPVRDDTWNDVDIGRVRLKLRVEESCALGLRVLEEIVPGDVLPSVSRRDERIKRVVLWTSGNRVFSSESPALLGRILDNLSRTFQHNDDDPTLDHNELSERALTTSRIRRIIEIEELELDVWSRSLSADLVELASSKG